MPSFDTLTLRVQNPARQAQFYRDILGMTDLGDDRIGYNHQQVALRFIQAETPYAPQRTDLYWKIAIAVPNIELAYQQLKAKHIAIDEPKQFRDVGYLAHIADPEGFAIELIDHHFQGDRPEATHNDTLLGGGPHLNLITLRTSDITNLEPQILAAGLKPLSVQPVTPYGFTLYFYAFTEDTPPDPNDLTAVANRTWVYQRQDTVLELQHNPDLKAVTQSPKTQSGYDHLKVRDANSESIKMLNLEFENFPS